MITVHRLLPGEWMAPRLDPNESAYYPNSGRVILEGVREGSERIVIHGTLKDAVTRVDVNKLDTAEGGRR